MFLELTCLTKGIWPEGSTKSSTLTISSGSKFARKSGSKSSRMLRQPSRTMSPCLLDKVKTARAANRAFEFVPNEYATCS